MKVLVKILKVIYSIISWILTPILSIVLVVGLIATALVGSVSTMVTPDSITNIVQNSVSSMILENEEIATAFEEMGLSAEATEKLFKSNFMNEFLNAYIGDMTDAITGKPVEQSSISPEKMKEIVNNNIDEVVDIFKDIIPEEEKPATDAELKEQILEFVNEQAEELVGMLPDPKELSEALQNPSGESPLENLFGSNSDNINSDEDNSSPISPNGSTNESARPGESNRNDGSSSAVVASSKTNPDGTITITYSDGRTETVSQQGGTVIINGNGNGTVSADDKEVVIIQKSEGTVAGKFNSFVTAQSDISSFLPLVQQFLNNSFTWYFIIGCVIVAALIFVLRLRKFGGLLWIGICCLISAVIVTAITVALSVAGSLITELAGFDISFILGAFSGKLTTSLLILYACGILSIAGFIVIKIFRNKKAATVEEATAEETIIIDDACQEAITEETATEEA